MKLGITTHPFTSDHDTDNEESWRTHAYMAGATTIVGVSDNEEEYDSDAPAPKRVRQSRAKKL